MLRIALPLVLVGLLAGCLDGTTDPDAATQDCPDAFTTAIPVDVPVLSGGGRVGDTDQYAVPVDLAPLVPADFAYSCVRAIEVRLAWTNTPTSGADLYVGIDVPGADLRSLGHDEQQLAGDGAHEESVLAAFWGPHDPARLADGITVLILSDWASLSQSGVPATVTISLLV